MAKFRQLASYLGNRRAAARLGASLLLGGAVAGVLAGSGPAAASAAQPAAVPTCPGWVPVRPPDPGAMFDDLFGVAVLSAGNVWAVGDYTNAAGVYRTLIEHWNGRAWQRVASPSPGIGSNYLSSVTAVSATNIWAAGNFSTQSGGFASDKTLILHWNGHTWSRVAAGPSGSNLLDMSASSATNVWAVGGDAKGNSLAMRWNGHTWSRVAAPSLKSGQLTNTLESVTVLSPTSAWAVGNAQNTFSFDSTAIEMHWNGHAWSMMNSPAPGGTSALFGVQATSAASPWAVGEYGLSTQVQRTLVFRCR